VANRTFYLSADNPQEIKNLGIYYKRSVLVAMQEFGAQWEVKFTQKKHPKTWQQCKGWHRILGVIVDLLNEHNVDNKFWQLEHVKYYVKRAIEYGEYRLDTFIPKSFADATKQEAIDIITKTQEFAIDELKIELEAVQLTSHEQQAFNEYYEKYT
jgi:hypothetical protein